MHLLYILPTFQGGMDGSHLIHMLQMLIRFMGAWGGGLNPRFFSSTATLATKPCNSNTHI